MKHLILNIILMVAQICGINALGRYLTRHKRRVLMYHGVTADQLSDLYWIHIPEESFDWQMAYLAKHFEVGPASTLTESRARSRENGKPLAVITFDDGLMNVYQTAWPILRRHSLSAICFVIPGLSEQRKRLWSADLFQVFQKTDHDEIDLTAHNLGRINLSKDTNQRSEAAIRLIKKLRFCSRDEIAGTHQCLLDEYSRPDMFADNLNELATPEQIKELAASDEFEIASHTHNHRVLASLTPEDQLEDISLALDKLREWGIDCPSLFSYPNGRFNPDTVEILKQLKFKAAVRTADGLSSPDEDRYHISRIILGADTNRWEFMARLSGFYYFLMKLVRA